MLRNIGTFLKVTACLTFSLSPQMPYKMQLLELHFTMTKEKHFKMSMSIFNTI